MASNPDLPPGMSDAAQNGSKFDIGALMRASRNRLGQEIQDAARTLRIRAVYLEAIEEGRFEDLPGPTYTVGFIRAYADYLGLDGEEVVRRFKAVGETPTVTQNLSFPTPVPDRGLPGGAILMIGIVVAVIGYGGWYFYTSRNSVLAEIVPEVPARLTGMLNDGKSEAVASEPTRTIDATSATEASTAPPAAVAATPPPAEPVQAAVESAGTADTVASESTEAAPATPAETPVTTQPLPAAEAAPTGGAEPAATAENGAAPAIPAVEPKSPAQAVMIDAAPDDVHDIKAVVAEQSAAHQEVAALPEPAKIEAPAPAPEATTSETASTETATPDATATETSSAEPAATETASAETAAQETASGDSQTASAAPLPNIEVHAKIDSWVQVRDDSSNQLVMTRLLKGGDSFSVPSRKGLTLLTGNAGALQIMVNGQVVPSIGPPGAVRRRVSLDASKLKAGNAVIE